MFSTKFIALTTACLMAASPLKGGAEQQSAIEDWDFFGLFNYKEIDNGNNDIQELIAQDTGIRVNEMWLHGQTPEEAIGSIIASDDYPEFIDGADGSLDLYNAGGLIAWDDYLSKPEFANLKAMYSAKEWDMFRQKDGKIYWAGVFNNSYQNYPMTRTYNGTAFWIQVRVLEWANYPTVETLDDYFDLLEGYYNAHKTNKDGRKIIPYTCMAEDWRYYCLESPGQFLDGYPNDGCVIVKDPGTNPTVVDFNTTETTKKYLQKLNTLYHKGLMDPDFAIQNYDEYIAKLSSGAVLGMCDQEWDFAWQVNDAFKAAGYDKLGYNYVPLGPTISKGMKNRYHTPYIDEVNDLSGIAVTKGCKDPYKAFKFLNRMLDQDMLNLRFWGVKDVDYLVNEKGEFYRTDAMRAKWEDPNYQSTHICWFRCFPQYGGMSRDGINTMHPEDSESEFFATMAAPLKKCFEAYGYNAYWQFLRSDMTAPIYPWYPLYNVSNYLYSDTDEGRAWIRMGTAKHEFLPKLVMSKDFDSDWDTYMEYYSSCKPELFINYIQKVVDSYKGQEPIQPPTPPKAVTPTPKPTPAPATPTPTPAPGQPTPAPTNGSIADFVERLYTVALGRPSEKAGKDFWVKEITSGNRTGADCAREFLFSQEFTNRNLSIEDFVETLYQTFFGRDSEPNGKAYWVGELKNGTKSRNDVINGFIDSTEWCNICADYGVRSGAPSAKAERASKNAIDFATRLYTCCLGRAAEDGGLKYWSLALTNLEQTGCSAAREFFKSQEFTNLNLKTEEYIKRLYTTFMDREPESSEVTYWAGEIAKGTQTRDSVLAFFGQSEEFTNICKKYGIERGTI